ncbi:MAG: aminotransferase class I/II-fold pyridoxal phosphate-dependent enzyme [Thermodesulfobacteriota bacterium]
MNSFFQALEADLENRCKQGILKGDEKVIEKIVAGCGGYGPRVCIKGHGNTLFLRMNSNSYLGLANHPELLAAAEEAAHAYGVGPGAVRFISGTTRPHIDLEDALGRFHNRPTAMIFNSAYAAVLGALAPLISPETAVISDELNHNSIINALRLAKPAAKKVYSHLDMADLTSKIKECFGKAQRVLVVSDGIFSMRGDHTPLAEISGICRKYAPEFQEGILTIIDDSHGVAVFGKTGRGTEEYCGAQADLLIGTLGKAFGVNGGYLTGEETIIRYLRETAACYIYSNPISPAEAAAAHKSVQIVDSSEGTKRLEKLRSLTKHLEKGLMNLDYQIITSDHPIVPVVTGDTQTNKKLSEFLFSKGILVTPLSYPVVPRGADEIRLQVSAGHEPNDIDILLAAMADFAEKRP